MLIRRLRLTNFRQHADTVLEFERGLTGIIGPNGAGKTTLLEAIAWAIYGTDATRGKKETLRRRGAPPRSRVEVELEFELGPHRYRIVRSLAAAELFQDGEPNPIANSLAAVTERVTRLLGMNRDEFFSTYFTGQKELAIMAQMTAPERAQFLSRVLGYEKLRLAQSRLKDRRRIAQATLDARKLELIDPVRLQQEEELAAERLRVAEHASARLAASHRAAEAELLALKPEAERWEALQQTVLSLEGDLKVAEHGAMTAKEQHGGLDRELAEALGAKSRLDELAPLLAPLPGLRAERDALDAAREAAGGRRSLEASRNELILQLERVDRRVGELPPGEELARVLAASTEVNAAQARLAQEAEVRRTVWVREKQDAETQRKNLLAQHEDLREQRGRLEKAGRDGKCPTCGRPLGDGYENVLDLLINQIEEVESQGKFYRQRIEQLQVEPADLVDLVRQRDMLEQEGRGLTGRVAGLTQQAAERVRLGEERMGFVAKIAELSAAISAAPESYDEPRHAVVKRQIAALEADALMAERLRALADRALDLVARAALAEQDLSRREAEVKALRERLAGLGWSAEAAEVIRARRRALERTVQQAEVENARAAGELTAALAQRAEVARRRDDRERRMAEVQRLSDALLLQHELDRALGDLRTDLNNTLRPDLSELASGFLRDLTTGRYTDLELDEDYIATIIEEGEPKPVISGGEEDVANLALRLAISQMIAERAGQPLSLLVLDEIFGSLDEERRGAVVDLLRNLADRFPQVIMITHIESVRDGFDRVIRLTYDVEQRIARAVTETRDAA
ncbi:MAG TPA: SMC family ATPase [Gemmatimonadales bacterium]|nr:SMC family ATPase [Gemmatimonadales bacterium]